MRVVYVDTGLANEVGHHATSCRRITAALRERGHEVRVAGWVGLDPALVGEFGASTPFRHNTYAPGDTDPICGWLAGHFLAAGVTTEDFSRLGPFTPDDLLYVNSVLPAQLLAVQQFLAALPIEARPETVVELGTDPGVDFVPQPDGALHFLARDPRQDSRATLYRMTARQMAAQRLPQLHLASFDATSSAVYASLLGTDVATLPLPHGPVASVRRRGMDGAPVVAFLGHQRGEKGYDLVPEIARLLLAARGDMRLLVHNAQPQGMAATQQAMRAIAASDSRLRLDERAAGPGAWGELLDASDLIVCPYPAARFRAAYSAVASEAIAHAIPLVAPAETTLARLMQDFDAGGGCFGDISAMSVADTVLGVLDDFPAQADRAQQAATRWTGRMGAGPMVDAMLGRLGAAAMAARAPFQRAA